jgi:hypothetical protein
MSASLIFPMNYHSDIPYLGKIHCGKGPQILFFMCSSLLESVIITEFQETEACSSLDLTKAKYSIDRLSEVQKENVILPISHSNFSA